MISFAALLALHAAWMARWRAPLNDDADPGPMVVSDPFPREA